jgi:hypothetical protein
MHKITTQEYADMLERPGLAHRSENGACSVLYASGDGYWVMSGPTGKHTLYADATDLARLNAHWLVFSR